MYYAYVLGLNYIISDSVTPAHLILPRKDIRSLPKARYVPAQRNLLKRETLGGQMHAEKMLPQFVVM